MMHDQANIRLLIKYIKSVLWRVAKCLSYIEEARCLKVKNPADSSSSEKIIQPVTTTNHSKQWNTWGVRAARIFKQAPFTPSKIPWPLEEQNTYRFYINIRLHHQKEQ